MAEAVLEQELTERAISLDIPARLQWDNANGYCGEASIQSIGTYSSHFGIIEDVTFPLLIGLFYGAWISQKLVRDLNKGEYLLPSLSANSYQERDPLGTLKRLHFTYEEWDWENSPQPQFRPFCRWMKRCLLRQHPFMFGIFLEGMDYDDYDHIVPAVGLRYRNDEDYDAEDELIYYDLYDPDKIEVKLNEDAFGATRASIDDKEDADDGCIPLDVSVPSRKKNIHY